MSTEVNGVAVSVTPTAAKPLTGIAAKVAAQREAALQTGNTAGRVATEVEYDTREDKIYIGFTMSDFVEAMGKSKSAKSEGATLNVSAKVKVKTPPELVAEIGDEIEYLIQGQPWMSAKILI